jgi:hypothetical protein
MLPEVERSLKAQLATLTSLSESGAVGPEKIPETATAAIASPEVCPQLSSSLLILFSP